MCVSMRFYRTEKTSGGNLLQEGMSKGDMNPVMYGILKMVEYKVQINMHKNFIIFTHAYYASCVRCPNSAFDGQK